MLRPCESKVVVNDVFKRAVKTVQVGIKELIAVINLVRHFEELSKPDE
jgi:hypothetical protein